MVAGVVLIIVSDSLSSYRNLQLAYGAYYFCVLAGLTVLAGSSGQISLGQGAFMAVGAYTFCKLNASPVAWSVFPALVGAVVAAVLIGIPVGAAASRLRGPYLAGATLAFAVGLPALADKFPTFLGGENGLSINPPIPPHWLGSNFPLERWEAWIACGGALLVLFVLYNLTHSAIGRSWRAVRDDEIAASLAGLRVGRRQTLAFVISAACAGLGGGLLAAVLQLTAPGAFPLQLSLTLLAGVVIGGLGFAGGRGLGSGAARAAPELDHRPRELVLALDERLPQPSDRDLRRRADRGDAGLAERDPGRPAGDRSRGAAGDVWPRAARRPPPSRPATRPTPAKDEGVRRRGPRVQPVGAARRRASGADGLASTVRADARRGAGAIPSSAACTSRSRS